MKFMIAIRSCIKKKRKVLFAQYFPFKGGPDDEKKAIKEFVVDLKKPYLGFCLGCQLLGEVVGGKVVKSKPAEIGIMDINFSENKNMWCKFFFDNIYQSIGLNAPTSVFITS